MNHPTLEPPVLITEIQSLSDAEFFSLFITLMGKFAGVAAASTDVNNDEIVMLHQLLRVISYRMKVDIDSVYEGFSCEESPTVLSLFEKLEVVNDKLTAMYSEYNQLMSADVPSVVS